ncbi:pyridoxal 5'-phosphate synthase glutaminase subunit PdxT [Mahella sp.]|uniref:pyridoxal 5'-phosphate synthase glutaminase subunit PdxT n=1 Tax=Mahella sp. TaxID=2798721 RepID=UPI0025BE3266|nr:pyridoxal 5'-phosphate synthase glutaminase subunit PdxT [Mahella sp.]
MRIGILGLQGSVIEHTVMLKRLEDVKPVQVKTADDLDVIDGLILPGGESTTIGRLITDYKLKDRIIERARAGMPVWGTCAGMILLAKHIINDDNVHLGLMNIHVRRNAYGSQLDSFKTVMLIPAVAEYPIPLVFIRAPYVEKADDGVEVLAELDGKIIAVRQGHLLATSFHPELTDDLSFHRYFADIVAKSTV